MKLIFCPQSFESFLQVDSITLGLCRQLCPKYLKQVYYFLQYLQEVSDEVDFLYADKHESVLQIDTMILTGISRILRVSKIGCLQYFEKEGRDEVDFFACR